MCLLINTNRLLNNMKDFVTSDVCDEPGVGQRRGNRRKAEISEVNKANCCWKVDSGTNDPIVVGCLWEYPKVVS